ncbi:hypothetical protein V5G24_20035 [Xanthobacter sp. VTT E-85241]|jgi:hypothetical protein|uniref:hypothetical protein n=1 Tax=Roseixanthobacter finlandensis TaxID=3119922 RepID=UPI00372988D7
MSPIAYFQPPLGGPSEAEVSAANEVLIRNGEARHRQIENTLLTCTGNVHGRGCGELSFIKDTEFRQTYYDHSGDGDTRMGEGNFICPKCGHRNRLYDTPEIEKLKRFFRTVIDDEK